MGGGGVVGTGGKRWRMVGERWVVVGAGGLARCHDDATTSSPITWWRVFTSTFKS